MNSKTLCKLRIHQYSIWRYVEENSCKQVRECKRCGYKKWRYRHEWHKTEVQKSYTVGEGKSTKGDDIILLSQDEYENYGQTRTYFEEVKACKRCGKNTY